MEENFKTTIRKMSDENFDKISEIDFLRKENQILDRKLEKAKLEEQIFLKKRELMRIKSLLKGGYKTIFKD